MTILNLCSTLKFRTYICVYTKWLPNVKLGSHRGDEVNRLGRRYLIDLDSSSKVRRQSIPENRDIQC